MENLIICLALTVLHFASSQTNTECPEPWVKYEDKCYKFNPFSLKLTEANQACSKDGASLLSVNSRGEHMFIAKHLQTEKLSRTIDQWWTSGERNSPAALNFTWQGDGTQLTGEEYWLGNNAEIRKTSPGTVIVYATDDRDWAWSLADRLGTGPSICEISLREIFRIASQSRGFDYGIEITDPTKFEFGPQFIQQPESVQYNEINNLVAYKDILRQYIEFNCFANGNPIPRYTWYKLEGGTRRTLDPLQDSNLLITNGKLRINKPSTERLDFGFYQCKAENKFGSILSDNVSLSFVSLGDFSRDSRVPIRAASYKEARIDCGAENIAQGYDRLLYSWYKDGDVVNNQILSDSKQYAFISVDGTLHFSSVTKDDAGYYQCQVTPPSSELSGQGKFSQPIRLIISTGTGALQDPTITEKYPKVWPSTPLVGHEVMIECIAYGTGELEYKWEKVGGSLPPSAELSNRNRVLLIPSAELIHSGTYTCICTSIPGTDATGRSDRRSVVLNVQAAPSFIIALNHEHADLNSELTWQCLAEGVPDLTYVWYKNSEVLQMSTLEDDPKYAGRYRITSNVMRIEGVTYDDAAMYQCGAFNTNGASYSSGQLRVVSFAPTFTKYPLAKRQYAVLRGNTTIVCNPEAAPQADISWKKNGRDMSSLSNNPLENTYLLNGNLVIRSVSNNDAGMYTCIASNNLGTAESTGELAILVKTVITTKPQAITILVHRTAYFHCEAAFNPVLDITYDWYQNNRKIDFERIFIIGEVPYVVNEPYFERGTGVNKGGLYIRDVQYFHAGNYTCFAKTSSDSASASAKLTVIGPPYPPVTISIDATSINATALRMNWTNGIYADNGANIERYYVEKQDLAKGFWEPADIAQQRPTDTSALVYNLSPYSRMMFRIRSENYNGIGEPSAPSEPVPTAQGKPQVAPQKVRRCIDKVGTLCIQWDCLTEADYDGEGFGYIVKWRESYIIDEEWDFIRLRDSNTLKLCKYVKLVGETKYWRDFDAVVQGYNNIGEGPISEEVVVQSSMGMPQALPTFPTAWQINATAILVEWNLVENDNNQLRGIVSGYRISYWRSCCGEILQNALFKVVHGQVNHGTIIGLYPDTQYRLVVQVFNEAGLGPIANPQDGDAIQETLRAAPMEAPQEVRVFVEGSNSVRLSWRGVDTTVAEEPLWGYVVLYWKSGENRNMAVEHNAGRRSHTIIGNLETDVLYLMRVAAFSRGGTGLMSSPTTQVIVGDNCHVREDSPDTRYVYRCRGDNYFESLYFSSGRIFRLSPLVVFLISFQTLLWRS